MPDEYDFIVEHGGRPFLEAGDTGEYVALEAVFREYSDVDNSAEDVAELFQISEKDVINGITYWTNNPDVYAELSGSVNDDCGGEDEDLEKKEDIVTPLVAARNGFAEIMTYEDSNISKQNIDDFPNESFFINNVKAETHLYWSRNGSELAVYAGWDVDEGLETGYVSFSVDAEEGPVLQVDSDEMEERVQEMYRNAVFKSRSR